jgi:type I restriction enzyme, R subunit
MARNMFPEDDRFTISKEENMLIQELIDQHLTSSGFQNLLAKPDAITDSERFNQEMILASPATRELKMMNHLKYTIKIGIDINPKFFKPLADDWNRRRFRMKLSNRSSKELPKALSESSSGPCWPP